MNKSLKERLEKIIKYDYIVDSEIYGVDHISNKIISLLSESLDEWLPKRLESKTKHSTGLTITDSLNMAHDFYNQALSQTEENFRKWLKGKNE